MIKYFLAALLFSGSASAAESEFFFQADEDQHLLSFAGLYNNSSLESGSTTIDSDGFLIRVQYEQGISEMLSWNVGVDYGNFTRESTSESKISGLSDLQFALKGRYMTSNGSLRFGADSEFGLQEFEVENDDDSNRASGGIKISPYIGYQWQWDQNVMGVRVARDIILKDSHGDYQGSDAEVDGGEYTSISIFYEREINDMNRMGFALGQTARDDWDLIVGGTSNPQDGENALYTLNLYGRFNQSNAAWVPMFAYTISSDDNHDKYDDISVALEYRMSL